MQKFIKLSEVHAALLNETFSLKTNNGQMTVEILDVDSYRVYAEALFGYDSVAHEIDVKLTHENGESEKAEITVMESHENLSCANDDLRNTREIKNLTDSIVQSIHEHASESYHAAGVKSLLKQAVSDYNEK